MGLCSRCYSKSLRPLGGTHNDVRRAKRAADPEKVRAQERAAYARKPGTKKKSALKYYEKNQERCKERVREYRVREAPKVRALIANYRAIAAGAGKHTGAERTALLEFYGWRCCRCAEDLTASGHHIDHIIPISRGGANDIENLRPLCPKCNLKKNRRLDHEVWT